MHCNLMKSDLTPGTTAVLWEDGSQVEVKILENLCTSLRETYKIQVLRLIQSTVFGTQALTVGDELIIDQPRDYILWELETQ
jgi:hypothetical protein